MLGQWRQEINCKSKGKVTRNYFWDLLTQTSSYSLQLKSQIRQVKNRVTCSPDPIVSSPISQWRPPPSEVYNRELSFCLQGKKYSLCAYSSHSGFTGTAFGSVYTIGFLFDSRHPMSLTTVQSLYILWICFFLTENNLHQVRLYNEQLDAAHPYWKQQSWLASSVTLGTRCVQWYSHQSLVALEPLEWWPVQLGNWIFSPVLIFLIEMEVASCGQWPL